MAGGKLSWTNRVTEPKIPRGKTISDRGDEIGQPNWVPQDAIKQDIIDIINDGVIVTGPFMVPERRVVDDDVTIVGPEA